MNSDFLPVPKFLEKRVLNEIKRHLPYSTKAFNMIACKHMGLFPERSLYFCSKAGIIDPGVFAIENVYLGAFKDNFKRSFAIVGKEKKIIEKALRFSKLFDWEQPMLFNTVPVYQLETYFKVAAEKKGNIYIVHSPLWLYCLQDLSKLQEIHIPSELEIKPLKWQNEFMDYCIWQNMDSKVMESIIKSGNCTGVFLKDTEELVSWFIINCYGSLGFLFTKEEFRGKGYAEIAISALTQQLISKGILIVSVDIGENNERSKWLFENLGFKPVFQYYIARYIPDSMKDDPKFSAIMSSSFNIE